MGAVNAGATPGKILTGLAAFWVQSSWQHAWLAMAAVSFGVHRRSVAAVPCSVAGSFGDRGFSISVGVAWRGIAAGQTHIIALPHKIPVAWVYLTGWVQRDGTVEFREDVYKHDDSLDRNSLAQAVNDGGFRRAGHGAQP